MNSKQVFQSRDIEKGMVAVRKNKALGIDVASKNWVAVKSTAIMVHCWELEMLDRNHSQILIERTGRRLYCRGFIAYVTKAFPNQSI